MALHEFLKISEQTDFIIYPFYPKEVRGCSLWKAQNSLAGRKVAVLPALGLQRSYRKHIAKGQEYWVLIAEPGLLHRSENIPDKLNMPILKTLST